MEEGGRDVDRITRLFQAWIEDGILLREERDSIYVYSQVFEAEGEQKRRTGIIPLVQIENFREKHIYPHEKVIAKHVEDRYNLMTATQANLGLIFGIYADPAQEVDRLLAEVLGDEPVSSCTMDAVLHELWKVDDEATRRLMVRFYDNLWNKKLSKLEALREAQLWMLKHPDASKGLARTLRGKVVDRAEAEVIPAFNEKTGRTDPFFWAAFQLSGDWR